MDKDIVGYMNKNAIIDVNRSPAIAMLGCNMNFGGLGGTGLTRFQFTRYDSIIECFNLCQLETYNFRVF